MVEGMLSAVGRRLSPSLVVSCIALFVALGGVGYAAVELPRNSVGELQLQRGAVGTEELQYGAVNSRKILDGSVHAADLAPGLLAGQQGAKGEKGDAGAGSAGTGGGSALTLTAADGTELGTYLGLEKEGGAPIFGVLYHGGIYQYERRTGILQFSVGSFGAVNWADSACTGTPYAIASYETNPTAIARDVASTNGQLRYVTFRLGGAGGLAGFQSTGRAAHPVATQYYVNDSGVCSTWGTPFDASQTYVELESAATPPSPAAVPLTIG